MFGIRCPECNGGDFRYKSDRSGNIRRYKCGDCGVVFIATIKGLPSGSVISEPKNLRTEDLEWARVVRDDKKTA